MPDWSEEIYLQFDCRERFVRPQSACKGHPHCSIRNAAENADVERPHGIRMLGADSQHHRSPPLADFFASNPIRRATGTSFTFACSLKSGREEVCWVIVIGSRLGSFALLERCFQGIPLDDDRPNHVNRRYAADGSPSNSLPACSRSMRCLSNDRVPRLFAFAHIRTLGKRNMRPNGRLLHLTTCLDASRTVPGSNERISSNPQFAAEMEKAGFSALRSAHRQRGAGLPGRHLRGHERRHRNDHREAAANSRRIRVAKLREVHRSMVQRRRIFHG